MMAWVDALKKFAEMKGRKYMIPKKGTADYNEVKKIQGSGKGALTKKEAKKMVSEMKREESGKAPRKPRKARVSSMMGGDTSRMMMEVEKALPKSRKPRSDKGKKRMRKSTLAGIMGSDTGREMMAVESSGKKMRKVRSDKGKARGPQTRLPKEFSSYSKEKAIASRGGNLQFDSEGNII